MWERYNKYAEGTPSNKKCGLRTGIFNWNVLKSCAFLGYVYFISQLGRLVFALQNRTKLPKMRGFLNRSICSDKIRVTSLIPRSKSAASARCNDKLFCIEYGQPLALLKLLQAILAIIRDLRISNGRLGPPQCRKIFDGMHGKMFWDMGRLTIRLKNLLRKSLTESDSERLMIICPEPSVLVLQDFKFAEPSDDLNLTTVNWVVIDQKGLETSTCLVCKHASGDEDGGEEEDEEDEKEPVQ
ncbi:hypothetical protein C8J57DRAFT_1211539 [Mycena rebaudengoi]|nr:hypothetical protein C8J57DRAFT_1211539 [Mycena rebaudengoi]